MRTKGEWSDDWADPHRWSDSETAICCQCQSPETLWFLILRATVVMNTGSDSRRHTIKVKLHPSLVSFLYTRLACRHSLFHPPPLSLAVFHPSHCVVLQSQPSFQSVLICLFVCKIRKQLPTNEPVPQQWKPWFTIEKKIIECKAK